MVQPLLSLSDIAKLLDYFLPSKSRSEAEVIGQIMNVTNSASKTSTGEKTSSLAFVSI